MAYATKAQLRAQIEKSGTSGAGADANLDLLLEAASEAVDGFCNVPTGKFVADSTASARQYAAKGGPVLMIEDCISITLVEAKTDIVGSYVSWAAADWIAFTGSPRFPDFNTLPYTGIMVTANGGYSFFPSGRANSWPGFMPLEDDVARIKRGLPTVRVTAKWGIATTAPSRVIEATLVQAARWFKRGEAAWADTVASPDMGTLQYRKALDPDVEAMLTLARLVRPAIGGGYG